MYRIIQKEDIVPTRWSGGTTSQIAISPVDGDYAARCFRWRVSSAVVEDEESTFTSLPGVARLILTLKGDLSLFHDSQAPVMLKPFEPHCFMGDQVTKSIGRVTDFNVMLKGASAHLEVETIEANGEIVLPAVRGAEELMHLSQKGFFYPDLEDGAGDLKCQRLLYLVEGPACHVSDGSFEGMLSAGDAALSEPSPEGVAQDLTLCNLSQTALRLISVLLVYRD